MADQDLSGSDLKLVRYKVLFTKRDYEHAFPEKEELVHDDMECNRFIAWKIAEFVQALKKEEDGVRRIPEKWATYLINEQKRKLTEPERTKIENDFDQEMSKDAKVSFEWEYVEVRRRKGNEHRYYYLRDLPHDDKKHLRLFYEVLDRYPREEFKHDERQIEVLEQIRDRLPR